MRTYLGHSAHRLGHVQKHVLLVLSTRGECARNDWSAWYPLSDEQVYGAMDSLGRRGLVDVAGFERGQRGREVRTFKLTSAGHEAVDLIAADDPEAFEGVE